MLKKLLIQLEPSKFGNDIQVIDLINLRKPIVVVGTIQDGELFLKLPIKQTTKLNYIIKADSSPVESLYPYEFTIIMEKPYKNENT